MVYSKMSTQHKNVRHVFQQVHCCNIFNSCWEQSTALPLVCLLPQLLSPESWLCNVKGRVWGPTNMNDRQEALIKPARIACFLS